MRFAHLKTPGAPSLSRKPHDDICGLQTTLTDIRYVVTNIANGSPEHIYDTLYCARGQMENLIKLHKSQLASDRTSCRAPLANQMRLILHTAAYWLISNCVTLSPKPIRSPSPNLSPCAKNF